MPDSRTSSRDEKPTVHNNLKPSKHGSQMYSNEKAINGKDTELTSDVEPVENQVVSVPFPQLFR